MKLSPETNKKGIVGMAMVDLWSFILVIVLVLAFWMLFSISGAFKNQTERLLEAESQINANVMLIGLLRHDVGDMSMVEFLIINYEDKDKVYGETRKILGKVCLGIERCYWELQILNEGEIDYISSAPGIAFENSVGESEFLLPIKDKRVVIKLLIMGEPKVYGL